jgi:hypothetical protein
MARQRLRDDSLSVSACGSHTAYAAGCRRSKCRSAQSRYARTRWATTAVLQGREAHWKVPSTRVLKHLDVLIERGWTLRKISVITEIPYPTLVSIRQGYRRGTSHCWNTVADRVLGLEP